MHKSKIINIINKAYPKIAKHYGSNAKVELHNNIYTNNDNLNSAVVLLRNEYLYFLIYSLHLLLYYKIVYLTSS